MSWRRHVDTLAGRMLRSRLFRYLATYAVLALAVFVASLQHFVLTLPSESRGQLRYTDGIIVMTGGQQRLAGGLELLAEGWAGSMLVSGVGLGINRSVLVNELDLNGTQTHVLFCCTDLDFTADNTRGNARAAKIWAEEKGLRSLRLVTSSYHMPRASLVFSSEMPEMELHQWPVAPADLKLDHWWRDQSMIRLLVREYAKYLTETLRA